MAKPPVDDATKALIERAQEDLAVYMLLAHRTDMPDVADGQAAPAEHHLKIIDVLMNGSLGNTVIVAPRDSAKTTIIQWYLEWKLGKASLDLPDWANVARFGYVSSAETQATRVSNGIKETIEGNDWYHLIFPKVKRHKNKWAENEWKVAGNTTKDANFVATGTTGSALGVRCLEMIFDDVFGEDEAKSPTERRRLLGDPDRRDGLLDQVFAPMVVPWGRLINICTRWAEDDAYTWSHEQGWQEIYMRAMISCEEANCPGCEIGEHSYWPERYPVAVLQEMRKERPLKFARQYQNEITPVEGITFKRDWFKDRFDFLPRPDEILVLSSRPAIFTSWDTAGTETGRSYTVGLPFIVTKDWHYYIPHMIRGKMDYPQLKQVIREMHRFWRVSYTCIEAKSTGQPALQELAAENMNVIGLAPPGQRGGPPGRNELEWVETITIPCEEGRVHLPSEQYMLARGDPNWVTVFLGELLSYPEGSNTDIVMAMTQFIFYMEKLRMKIRVQEALTPDEPLHWGDPAEQYVSPRRRKYLARHPEPERKLLV